MLRFYASDSRVTGWEEDMLGRSTLAPGQQLINIDDGSGACLYDFKAEFTNGQVLTRMRRQRLPDRRLLLHALRAARQRRKALAPDGGLSVSSAPGSWCGLSVQERPMSLTPDMTRRAATTGLLFTGYAGAALAREAHPIVTPGDGLVTETVMLAPPTASTCRPMWRGPRATAPSRS